MHKILLVNIIILIVTVNVYSKPTNYLVSSINSEDNDIPEFPVSTYIKYYKNSKASSELIKESTNIIPKPNSYVLQMRTLLRPRVTKPITKPQPGLQRNKPSTISTKPISHVSQFQNILRPRVMNPKTKPQPALQHKPSANDMNKPHKKQSTPYFNKPNFISSRISYPENSFNMDKHVKDNNEIPQETSTIMNEVLEDIVNDIFGPKPMEEQIRIVSRFKPTDNQIDDVVICSLLGGGCA